MFNFAVLLATWCCLWLCLSSSSSSAPHPKTNNCIHRFFSACVFGEEASKVTTSLYGVGGLINILAQGTKYTPAEITTGLHLLRMLQKHYGLLDEHCDANKLNYEPIQDTQLLKECEYYTLFANAAYGIPLYSMSSPCAICCAPPCCLPRHFDDPHSNQMIPETDKVVLRENKCCYPVQIDNSSFKIFVQRTHCQHPQNDVLLVAQVGGLHKVNFYVIVDRIKQCLVIAIRGTLSLGDTITDANTEPELCSYIQTDTECYVHKGIGNCAADVFHKLMKSKAVIDFVKDEKYKHYAVVVTGHSLGGGSTVLLSLMMRYGVHEHLKYFLNDDRTFKAYAIAPPSCIDRDFALKKQSEIAEFLTCVILGHDLVPRLSFYNLVTTRAAIRLLLNELDKTDNGPWWVYKKSITTKKNTILQALPDNCAYCSNVSCTENGIDEKQDDMADSTEIYLLPKTSGEASFINDVAREVEIMKKAYDDKLEKCWSESHVDEDYKNSDLCKNNKLLWNVQFCQGGNVVYVMKERCGDDDNNDDRNECCECMGNICTFICRSMLCNVCRCRCCLDPKDTKYKAYMANIDIFCSNMIFSKDMMPDHMPHLYLDVLQRLNESKT